MTDSARQPRGEASSLWSLGSREQNPTTPPDPRWAPEVMAPASKQLSKAHLDPPLALRSREPQPLCRAWGSRTPPIPEPGTAAGFPRALRQKWIDGRLEELYRGREADMPDEVNIDELLELESEEERSRKIQGLLKSCTNPTEDFVQELLAKLRGLHKQPGLRQPSPSGDGSLSPRQDRARTAPR
nr:PREDICTED: protein phosphatase 1 regulatory subunit 14A [Bos mutus]